MNRRNQRLAVKTNERKGEFNIYKQTSTDSKLMAKYKANMKLAPGPQHLKQEKEKAEKKREKEEARSLWK